jgi:hypothetical protein
MALKLAQLENLTDDELRRAYDDAAPLTQVGLEWYREELSRRRYERDAKSMHALTKQTVRLTVVNSIVAILAIIVAVISLWLR